MHSLYTLVDLVSPESTNTGLMSARGARAEKLAESAVRQAGDSAVLDRIIAAAAERLGVAGVSVSMLSDRQITVAGSMPDGTPIEAGLEFDFEDSICANALRTDEPLAIPDTRADARVSSIPMVSDGPVRAYLGSAIRTDEGVVAVLCVFDSKPRQWTTGDAELLTRFADEVRTELLRFAATPAG